MGQSDDDLARDAILRLCEAVRLTPSNPTAAETLVKEAEAIARRIDRARGAKAEEATN